MDINSQICESDLFSNWCLGAKGGKHLADFISMCKCVTELGIVCPVGDAIKHARVGEYGTYSHTVGNKTIVVDQIGTIGHIQVLLESICIDPSLARALHVDKDHIPISAEVLIPTSSVTNHHVRRRVVKYDLSKVNDQDCAEAFRTTLHEFPVIGV